MVFSVNYCINTFFITVNFNKILLSIISIVLFCNAIFAAWHAGIEWDLWPGLVLAILV